MPYTIYTYKRTHDRVCPKTKPESIPRARHPDDTPTPTGPMERLMRDLRRLEDEIHASTSSPTRTGTTRRRSRSVTPTTGGSPARGARIGFLTNDDVADDDDAAAAGDARTRLRDARAAIEDAAKALAVEEETEMRRGRALGALDGRTTVAHAGDKETTTKRVATTTTKRIRRNDDGDDDIDALTTPVVPRETRSTRAATTPMS
jgi:hypothetical protein